MLFIFRKIRRSFFLPNKAKTYLTYAVGEIALIMIGILLALQVSDWNQETRDRREERMILTRINSELESGLSVVKKFMPKCQEKKKSLNQVLQAVKDQSIDDVSDFILTVEKSTELAFSQPRFPSITFEEIISSNKLGLIRNVDLRSQIGEYYYHVENAWRIVEVRRGDYPRIVYKLLLREDGDKVKNDLSDDQQKAAVNTIFDKDLEEEIISELNRNNYMMVVWETMVTRINNLREVIQAELAK